MDAELMRLADDGCPNCGDYVPRGPVVFIVRNDYNIYMSRETAERLSNGELLLSVYS